MSPRFHTFYRNAGWLIAASLTLLIFVGCATVTGVGSDPQKQEIPSFPWPPPRASSTAVLDRTLLESEAATLGSVASRLSWALSQVGHSERSFYFVPGGFALATRIEQIEEDGTPKAEPMRWSVSLPPRELFSFGHYLRALFTAPEGNYRVIVFVVSDKPFKTLPEAATEEEAEAWLSGGLNFLPASIAIRKFGPGHNCTALVYQFRKVGQQQEPVANPDGAPSATQQLTRSGILKVLKQ